MAEKRRLNCKIFSHVSASNHGLYILFAFILLVLLSVSFVLATVYQESPADSLLTSSDNNTIEFKFNISAADGLATGAVECNLTLNGIVVATNSSVVNDISTTLKSNTSFNQGANPWYVICGNTTHTNQSTPTRTLNYDSVNPDVTSPSLNVSEVKLASSMDVNVTATDDNTVVSVMLNSSIPMSLVGGVWTATTTPTALGCTADAVCTLGFTATDPPGNVNDTVTKTVIIDDTAPVVNFVYNSSDVNNSANNFVFNITVTEINTNASVTANGQPMSPVAGTDLWEITETGDILGCTVTTSACTITFNATDGAGNLGADTTTIQIDNDAPIMSGESVNVTKARIGDDVMIRITATDTPGGVLSVTVNGTAMTDMGGGLYEVNESGTNLNCGADSLCNLTFTAIDNFGAGDDSVYITYTTDNTGPTNTTAFSASPGSTSATISATMNEAAKCTVEYGTHAAAASSADSSAFSTSMSVALSGLSASTVYYYNITDCWDELGNVASLNEGEFSFTTSASVITSSGGGGGGSSGSYIINSEITLGDMTGAETSLELKDGDFITFGHDGEDHEVRVTGLGRSYADIEVLSEPQTFRLYVGQSKDVDLDGDAKAELTVKLMDIVYNKALVKVTSLVTKSSKIELLPPAKRTPRVEPVVEQAAADVTEEAAPAEPEPVAEVESDLAPTEPVVESDVGANWYWYVFSGVVALVLVALAGMYIFEKKRQH